MCSNNTNHYEQLVQTTLDKYIPFKVDWEITYRCNLKCEHCYQTGPSSARELTTKEIFSVLDQLADLGCLYLTLTGGEVLLREDFFDIARYAQKKRFAVRIFSNGTLIDEETAEKIKAVNPLAVEISLYGMDPQVHEGITGVAGSYQKTVNAVHLLRRHDINTVVKCTVMKQNGGEFDKLREFSRDTGAVFTFAFTVIPKVNGDKEILKFRLPEEVLGEFFRQRDWLVADVGEGGVYTYKPLCAAGFNSLYISPYGEVFPCVVLREDCGNVRSESLKDIWQSPFFKKLRQIQFEDLALCAQCTLAHYCDRCAGLAWLETGDMLGISPNDCMLARARKWAVETINQDTEARKQTVNRM